MFWFKVLVTLLRINLVIILSLKSVCVIKFLEALKTSIPNATHRKLDKTHKIRAMKSQELVIRRKTKGSSKTKMGGM